ncbi:hypothetical protein GCM10009801_08570 [Streptomyces albiaxialis]|uniref:Transposase n=1 Tax=Streptomyces albiaxialis TaxID=329523 RepID=A0ABP5H3W4_9ACTN
MIEPYKRGVPIASACVCTEIRIGSNVPRRLVMRRRGNHRGNYSRAIALASLWIRDQWQPAGANIRATPLCSAGAHGTASVAGEGE